MKLFYIMEAYLEINISSTIQELYQLRVSLDRSRVKLIYDHTHEENTSTPLCVVDLFVMFY